MSKFDEEMAKRGLVYVCASWYQYPYRAGNQQESAVYCIGIVKCHHIHDRVNEYFIGLCSGEDMHRDILHIVDNGAPYYGIQGSL